METRENFFYHFEGNYSGCTLIFIRRVRRRGVHWVHVHTPPPPTWEKSSAQKCPKEEKKFHPDMAAKRNVHVPLRYDKIKTRKVEKKEEKSKRKGIKLKK